MKLIKLIGIAINKIKTLNILNENLNKTEFFFKNKAQKRYF